MTLSDKPGPSLSFSHKDYSLKVYTRERRRKEGEGKRRRIILIFFFLFSFFFGKHYKQPAILSGLCAQISLCFSLLSLLEPHWTPQRHCPWLGKWQITSAIAASQGTAVPSSLPSSPLLSSPLLSPPLLSSPWITSFDLQFWHQSISKCWKMFHGLYVTIAEQWVLCAYAIRICVSWSWRCWTRINNDVSLDHVLC